MTIADPDRWVLFDSVAPEQAAAILSVARRTAYKRGETVVREGTRRTRCT